MGTSSLINLEIKSLSPNEMLCQNEQMINKKLEEEKERLQERLETITSLISDFNYLKKDDSGITTTWFLKKIGYYIYRAEKDFLETRLLFQIGNFLKENKLETEFIGESFNINKYNYTFQNENFFKEDIKKNDFFLRFKLPKMPQTLLKNFGRTCREYMPYITQAYVKLAKEKGLLTQYEYNGCLVVFDHHQPFSSVVPDADNYDAKLVLDALNEYCFQDDSLKNISVSHIATNDEKTFTYVYLIKKGNESIRKLLE